MESEATVRANDLASADTRPWPARTQPRTPHAARRPFFARLRRLVSGVLLAAILLAGLGAVVGGFYLATLPSVSDAPQRVAAYLRLHHAIATTPPAPQKIAAAIVAVEDHRFYANHGIDVISMAHFAWGYLSTGSTSEAGATITEQLVKILYIRDPGTPQGEMEMLGLSLKLNQSYSKAQILTWYLDVVYYGHQAYGITQAAATYFHTTPARLTWGEASLLAGLPQAPSAYDPFAHHDLARMRQRHVLARLVAVGALTQAQADQAYAQTPTIP
ncbi:MAG: transglycosylase domain-containing protein [Chloroflexota bacterium]|nr:transglycosylase domain-containing protein [Chloroflexota bacterium]